MVKTKDLAIGLGVVAIVTAVCFVLVSGSPKYKVGDILYLSDGEAGYFDIIDVRKGPSEWEYHIRQTVFPYLEGWAREFDLSNGTYLFIA